MLILFVRLLKLGMVHFILAKIQPAKVTSHQFRHSKIPRTFFLNCNDNLSATSDGGLLLILSFLLSAS